MRSWLAELTALAPAVVEYWTTPTSASVVG
jgi:hypothetical protein